MLHIDSAGAKVRPGASRRSAILPRDAPRNVILAHTRVSTARYPSELPHVLGFVHFRRCVARVNAPCRGARTSKPPSPWRHPCAS